MMVNLEIIHIGVNLNTGRKRATIHFRGAEKRIPGLASRRQFGGYRDGRPMRGCETFHGNNSNRPMKISG